VGGDFGTGGQAAGTGNVAGGDSGNQNKLIDIGGNGAPGGAGGA